MHLAISVVEIWRLVISRFRSIVYFLVLICFFLFLILLFIAKDHNANGKIIISKLNIELSALLSLENGTLFAGAKGSPVLCKSTDFGMTWSTLFNFSALYNTIRLGKEINSLFVSKSGTILVNPGYSGIWTSFDGGQTFLHTLRRVAGCRAQSFTETRNGTIFFGTYGEAALIYRSTDFGRTWNLLINVSGARHVHFIQADPNSENVYVSLGDNLPGYTVFGLFRLSTDGLQRIGFLQQPVAIDFCKDGSIILGSDAYPQGVLCLYPNQHIEYLLNLSQKGKKYDTPVWTIKCLSDGHIFAGSGDIRLNITGYLWESTDAGLTWNLAASFPTDVRRLQSTETGILYVLTVDGELYVIKIEK